MKFQRITVNLDQMDGLPCIRGGFPLQLLDMVASGITDDEILEAYPDLELDEIQEAIQQSPFVLFYVMDGLTCDD